MTIRRATPSLPAMYAISRSRRWSQPVMNGSASSTSNSASATSVDLHDRAAGGQVLLLDCVAHDVLHLVIVEKIGIRELRQRASEWVAKAKGGKVILITDRGQPVARLMPLTPNENARNKLIDDGQLIPAAAPRARFSTDDLVSGPPLTPILDELRSER